MLLGITYPLLVRMHDTSRDLDGIVIHIILIPFQLARRIYGLALPSVCILMQDCNNGPMFGLLQLLQQSQWGYWWSGGFQCHGHPLFDQISLQYKHCHQQCHHFHLYQQVNQFWMTCERRQNKGCNGVNLMIPLAIDHNLLILGWRCKACIGLAHELYALCILGLGCGQDICQVTRLGRSFLLWQESK